MRVLWGRKASSSYYCLAGYSNWYLALSGTQTGHWQTWPIDPRSALAALPFSYAPFSFAQIFWPETPRVRREIKKSGLVGCILMISRYSCLIVVPQISKMCQKTVKIVSKNFPNTKMSPKYLQKIFKTRMSPKSLQLFFEKITKKWTNSTIYFRCVQTHFHKVYNKCPKRSFWQFLFRFCREYEATPWNILGQSKQHIRQFSDRNKFLI